LLLLLLFLSLFLFAEQSPWHARDNIALFLKKCEELGVPHIVLFETADLAERRNEKRVTSTILALSRAAVKFGFTPPLSVQYEMEIERLEREEAERRKRQEIKIHQRKPTADRADDTTLDYRKTLRHVTIDEKEKPVQGSEARRQQLQQQEKEAQEARARQFELRKQEEEQMRALQAVKQEQLHHLMERQAEVARLKQEQERAEHERREAERARCAQMEDAQRLAEMEEVARAEAEMARQHEEARMELEHLRVAAEEEEQRTKLARLEAELEQLRLQEMEKQKEAERLQCEHEAREREQEAEERELAQISAARAERERDSATPCSRASSRACGTPLEPETDSPVYVEFKDYQPDVEDLIDRAVAERLNEIRPDNLVVCKVKPGCYQIGEAPYTYLRLVRNILMARVGGGWMGFKVLVFRKMTLRKRASNDTLSSMSDDVLKS